MPLLGAFSGIVFLIVGIIQIIVGYIGIEYHLGSGFAIGALILGFVFRIMFPLTIGTFFGALDVFGWPWFGALALAAPGLLFIVPAMITSAIANLTNSNTNRTYSNNFSFSSSINDNKKKIKNVTHKKAKKKTKKKKKIK